MNSEHNRINPETGEPANKHEQELSEVSPDVFIQPDKFHGPLGTGPSDSFELPKGLRKEAVAEEKPAQPEETYTEGQMRAMLNDLISSKEIEGNDAVEIINKLQAQNEASAEQNLPSDRK